MCLALPGRLVRWIDRDPLFARAEVEFDGIRRICHMACVLEANEGDYVIVHAGVAISRVDEAAARQTLAELDAFGTDPRDELREELHGNWGGGPSVP
ncbi:MAG: HypC/HybG/HupF family hydrogenase formation chaperone [Planctomycetota bacterium]|nr:HypC/HybG/HupF family hydrogenase formation chaperone [Planctomycetota bacterium]